jgi:hypothetical protein
MDSKEFEDYFGVTKEQAKKMQSLKPVNPWNMTNIDLAYIGHEVGRRESYGMNSDKAIVEVKAEFDLSDKDVEALKIYLKK